MNTAIILILGIPLIEIYLFIKIGSEIGALNTILLILTTAVVGIWYARYEGLILPGFATDVLGILLVFPVTRKIILSKYSKKNTSQKKDNDRGKNYIEGEYEDIEDKDGK